MAGGDEHADKIDLRRLITLDEMRTAVEVQQAFWGIDLESVVPAHMLFSLATYGGHVIAAFDGERMVGVLIGFLGASKTNEPAINSLQVVSKRMVVLPDYRGKGIGYQLKLEQRRLAIEQGVELVSWTFDPLLALNAHLNIRKLGAVSRTYLENYYGTAEGGGLTTLGFSDRLLVEWWVKRPHVIQRLEETFSGTDIERYLKSDSKIISSSYVNPAGHVVPAEEKEALDCSALLLEIPVNYGLIVHEDPELARTWRLHTRELFQRLFRLDYVISDFVHESFEGRLRTFFVLSRNITTSE